MGNLPSLGFQAVGRVRHRDVPASFLDHRHQQVEMTSASGPCPQGAPCVARAPGCLTALHRAGHRIAELSLTGKPGAQPTRAPSTKTTPVTEAECRI